MDLIDCSFDAFIQFTNSIATQHFVSVFMVLPLVSFFVLYLSLPFLKGKRKLICVLLFLFTLLIFILPAILGARSFIINHDSNNPLLPGVLLFIFSIFMYRGLKERVICSWINDDEKYKELTTPKDGRNIHMTFPHPGRLTIEAGLIFGYWALFIPGVIYSVIAHALGFGFIACAALLAIAGVMALVHIMFVSFEKCPYCGFEVFELNKEHKSKAPYFLVVAYQILFKKAFHCMHCGAYFTVKKDHQEKIKE